MGSKNKSPSSTTTNTSKMTRTTRMFFVEEISDAEKENVNKSASFKTFELETKVQSTRVNSNNREKDNGISPNESIFSPKNMMAKKQDDSLGNSKQENEEPTVESKSRSSTPGSKSRSGTPGLKRNKIAPDLPGSVNQELNEYKRQFPSKMQNVQADICATNVADDKRGSIRSISGTTVHHIRPRAPSLLTNLKAPKNLQMHVADELKTIEDTLLYSTLHPLFVCMKLSGLFFIRRKKSHEQGCKGFFMNSSALQWYCGATCIMLLLNFLRSMTAFSNVEGFNSELFFKLLTCIFFYESASRAMLAYWACWRKKNGLQELVMTIQTISYPDGIIPYEQALKRWVIFFLWLTFLTSLANVGMTAYGMFGIDAYENLFLEVYLSPLETDADGALGFAIFLLIITFINGTVAILSLTFFTVFCYILYKEFEYLCRTFVMKIKEDGHFGEDLESFRRRHQKRCKLVEAADQNFKYYIANTYLCNVPLLCLLLYSIVYTETEDTVTYRVISTFRLCYVLMQMMVLSVIATMINDHAHAPLADIYSIRVQDTTPERNLEVSMFLNKLTGTSIGLTAWDMFVINKPTVLTVIGMILTYFFLLVQFKNPLQGSTNCNCTFACNGSTMDLGLLVM